MRTDDEIVQLVTKELDSMLGVEGAPSFRLIKRWARAIPQYTTTHAAAVARVNALEKSQPGLYFCANYRGGISVGDCVKSADAVVGSIAASLGAPA